MKKKLLLLLLIPFLLTGCLKYEYKIDIKRDKSMDLDLTIAFSKSLLQDSNNKVFTDEELQEYKEKGFEVVDYDSTTMKGYTLKKHFDTIDKYSGTSTEESNINALLEDGDKKFFIRKKGILADKYTINMTADTSKVNSYTQNRELTEEELANEVKKGMELKFELKLPYPSIDNNATSKKKLNTELEWDLSKMTTDDNTIKCEFYILNLKTCIALLIAIIILIIILKSKNKKPTNQIIINTQQPVQTTPQVPNNTQVINNPVPNNQPVQNNIPNQNNNFIQNNNQVQNNQPVNQNLQQNSLEDFYNNK